MHPVKTDTDTPFFRFSSNLYTSLLVHQIQVLRHEHRRGPHQMPSRSTVDMGPADGTCCSDVSRGSCRSLPWAELARYFHQLKILLTETWLTTSKYQQLPMADQANKQCLLLFAAMPTCRTALSVEMVQEHLCQTGATEPKTQRPGLFSLLLALSVAD